MSIWISQTSGRDDNVSPRAAGAKVIKAAGCTNMVLAHFVMDAAVSGIPATVLFERVRDIGPFTLTQTSKWFVRRRFNLLANFV